MRYSGEGTQENPYIPEDFTGFLHCIAQTDSYVKLESDIDAAADSGYEGILYEPVTFNCKECYADELKKIIGATVCANNAFYVGSSESDNRKSVRNIGFIDWSFKQNGNTSNGAGNLFKIGDYFTLYGCSFSVQSAGQNWTDAISFWTVVLFRWGAIFLDQAIQVLRYSAHRLVS